MELLPISALQHLLYCERQCALIHVEQVWAENRFTAEGNVMHEKAHGGISNFKSGISESRTHVVRGLEVVSEVLGLSGQCDVVEFEISDLRSERAGDGVEFEISPCAAGAESEISNLRSEIGCVLPIEYKRGKPKGHRADEVQLCAQALCLEEMMGISVPEGRLFYGQTRRRTDVRFDAELRALTVGTARRLHELMAKRETPAAVYEVRKCEACSLLELCMPQAMRFQKGAGAWFRAQISNLKSQISD